MCQFPVLSQFECQDHKERRGKKPGLTVQRLMPRIQHNTSDDYCSLFAGDWDSGSAQGHRMTAAGSGPGSGGDSSMDSKVCSNTGSGPGAGSDCSSGAGVADHRWGTRSRADSTLTRKLGVGFGYKEGRKELERTRQCFEW